MFATMSTVESPLLTHFASDTLASSSCPTTPVRNVPATSSLRASNTNKAELPSSSQPSADSTAFQVLIDDLTAHLTSHASASVPELTALLDKYQSVASHWIRFAHTDPSKAYTRNLVAEVPGVYNLLLLVWSPGQKSKVHDHADAHCLMRILQGSLVERRYGFPSPQAPSLQLTAERTYSEGRVAYMADELGVHSIGNPSADEYAVSLHLYTPPNAALRGCRVFGPNGEVTICKGEYDSVLGARK